jgi:hypothetical protein
VKVTGAGIPAGAALSVRLTVPGIAGTMRGTAVAREGKATAISVRLNAKARAALRKKRRLKVRLAIGAIAPDGSSATISRRATLKYRR